MARSLGADQVFSNFVGAAADLATHAQGMDTFGIFVIDGEEIVDGTIALVARHSVAHANRLDRMRTESPVKHIEIVNVLFDDVVTTQPHIGIPVIDLISGVAHAGPTFSFPQGTLVPVGAAAD